VIYIELRVLEYFLAVAREQSISAAAKSLHLSQPTLSTQLKSLEEEMGKTLFLRGTKGSRKIALTEEGMILQKRAQEILELVQKTEKEISLSDDTISGDISIGAGESQIIRLFAQTAKQLRKKYPDIRYHIFSGNALYVMEQLEKGLIDFGLIYGTVDTSKYQALKLPVKDQWGVLMKKDSPLAYKERITPEDLWDKPLIISNQKHNEQTLSSWLKKDFSQLNIAATYNLVFNASLLTSEGLGYTLCFEHLVNTSGDSDLCFRPLFPKLEAEASIIWKKYALFSKASEKFLQHLESVMNSIDSLESIKK
jgi:DNA-binding transcriptional LysR family regulator